MIVFSDMDGTLLTSDKQVSDATWAMLDELARRGIEFVPCTGRPLSGVFEPILAHPAVHYAVCANGASVWQLDEDTPTDASRAPARRLCCARFTNFAYAVTDATGTAFTGASNATPATRNYGSRLTPTPTPSVSRLRACCVSSASSRGASAGESSTSLSTNP